MDRVAFTDPPQNLEAIEGRVSTGKGLRPILLAAHADNDRIEPGLQQFFGVDLIAQLGPAHEAHARVPQRLQLPVEHLLREAELRDRVSERSSRFFTHVVQGDLVTPLHQEPGGGETCRAGTDDDHPLPGRNPRDETCSGRVIGDRAMEGADGDRLVHLTSPAHGFAVAGADPTQYAGERQFLAHERGRSRGVPGG